MQRMSDMPINHNACFRVVKVAQMLLYGDQEKSLSLLPRYFERLKQKMPGTVAFVEAGEDDRFSGCFLAFSASITGQKYCKPVIQLDGCFIKDQYLGTILVALTQFTDIPSSVWSC
ncbi:hypothetical protein P9112_003543 [Eukaryota sp. TZLM1-RC]